MMAETMLANGATVVAMGRSGKLETACESWRHSFGDHRVHSYTVDMYDLTGFSAVLDRITAEHHINVLVNNAHELGPQTGFNIPEGSLEESSLDQWSRNITAGVYWPLLAVQKVGGQMKAKRSGSIINIATMYALVAPRPALYAGTNFLNPPGYSAAKAAMVAFTRYVASFWGPHNIRANAILPGPFSNTQNAGPNSVQEDDPFLQKLKGFTSLGRTGRPEELAGALLLLASDASSFITGQALVVDGGWTAV
jgi:gluconate 5-dehydrogenase